MTRRFKTRKIIQRFLAEDSDLAATTPGLVGSRISKYKILKVIGRGGMGTVYQAEDLELRRVVALKILREGVIDPRAVERFHREARIAAQFQHPNIVPIYDVGTIENTSGAPIHFLAMAYVEGRTLDALIGEGTTKRDELLRILEDVSRAVSYAHSKGVVHRDIKPQNVMIDARGNVLLMDFGLAHAEFFETQLTKSQAVMGTPRYMAPEQVLGHMKDIGPSTDIYALGMMLYECLAGDIPFAGTTPAEIYQRILHELPAPPRSAEKDLEVICMKAIEKKPGHRYSQASDFADEIGRFRRKEPITARPPSIIRKVGRRLFGNRIVLTALIIGTLFLVVGGAIVLPYLSGKDRELIAAGQKRADTLLDLVLSARRADDLKMMKDRGAELDQLCRDLMAKVPNAPEPHYLRGRMLRAEMDFDGAIKEQDQALQSRPTYAAALYEKVAIKRIHFSHAKGSALLDEIVEGTRSVSSEDPPHETPQMTSTRKALVDDLSKLLSLEAAAPTLGPGQSLFLKGVNAVLADRPDDARRALKEAIDLSPQLDEAYECLMNLEDNCRRYEEGVALADRAIKIDRGYANYYFVRAWLSQNLAAVQAGKGVDPIPRLTQAIEDTTRILEARGLSEKALSCRSRAYYSRAIRKPIGAEQLADLEECLHDGEALKRFSTGPATLLLIASARASILECRWRMGLDPTESYQEALTLFSQVLAEKPRCEFAFLCRGRIRKSYGEYLRRQDLDFTKIFREAIADFTSALEINPKNGDSVSLRAYCGYFLGRAAALTDPTAMAIYDQTIADYAAVLETSPQDLESRYRRGTILYKRAKDKTLHAAAAAEDCDSAEKDLTLYLEKNPDNEDALYCRADIHLMRAVVAMSAGKEPRDEALAGIKDAENGVRKNPAHVEMQILLGNLWLSMAFFAEIRHADFVAEGQKASEAFDRAIKLKPSVKEMLPKQLKWIRDHLDLK